MSTLRQRRIQEDESRQRAETSSLSSAGEDYLDEEEEEEAAEESAAAPVTLLRDAPSETRFQSFVTRASWSLVMIFAFLFIVVYLQQTGCAVLVCIIQGLMYKELVVIQMNESSERDLPGFKFLYAYWFMVTSIFTYGKTLEGHFLMHSLRHHLGFKISDHLQKFDLYCYLLYAFGLILFVWSLKKKHYKYQFKQFAYCHVTLLLVVVQSSALVANMFHGLIWFLLPCSLVICNDIWAYIFGFFFGRTPLIKLSPKKTWEGFVGGWLATMFFGFFLSKIFTKFGLMICERRGFRLEYWPECEIDPIYEYRPLHDILGPRMNTMLPESISSMQVQQMDEHVLWMAIFASIVAPFGGFFASGFKRAFKIKDFGDSIPGHGGAVDRMDCQVLMGMFVYVYYQARVAKNLAGAPSLEVVLRLFHELGTDDKVFLFEQLRDGLVKQGLIGNVSPLPE